MNPLVVFLVQEAVRITLERLNNAGKFQNLTQEEADAAIKSIEASLSSALPAPGDLESAT